MSGVVWAVLAWVFTTFDVGVLPASLDSHGSAALAAAALVGLLGGLFACCVMLRHRRSPHGQPWVRSLAERAAETTYLRLADPNAGGRPRPRAPSARPSVA